MKAPEVDLPRYYRPLGLHEGYSLARAQVGLPVNLCIVAKVTPSYDITFRQHLQQRIDALLSIYPLLSAAVTDDRSSQPGFYTSGDVCTHERVLFFQDGLSDTVCSEKDDDQIALNLLRSELWECGEGGGRLSSLKGPMWRVIARQHATWSHCWLTLTASHIITDGKGLAALFELLLASNIDATSPLKDIPPSSSQAFITTPSYRLLISTVWAELLVPKLPYWMQGMLKSNPHWPTSVPIDPLQSTPQIDLVLLEADLVTRLKRTAVSNDIKTVTPLLHSAASLALISMIGFKDQIKTTTPMSVRHQAGPDATLCTGNFVSSANHHLNLSPEMALWPIMKAYAALLADPTTASKGLQTLGMLAYIPDDMKDPPPTRVPYSATQGEDNAAPTSWEHFFRKKIHLGAPYASSFDVTNAGLIKMKTRIQNVIWSPSAVPIGAALLISVIGFSSESTATSLTNGLSVTLATRKGLVDGDTFTKRMKRAILIFANGHQISKSVTVGEVVQLIIQ